MCGACGTLAAQGYLMERSKSRATEEANSRLERQSRELEAQAKLKHMCDRAELDRCRQQMSEFVGPAHRHMKQLTNAMIDFMAVRGFYPKCFAYFGSVMKSEPIYGHFFPPELIEQIAADPQGECAREYRRLVRGVLLPSMSTIRKLILEKASDLAEKPPEEEWEKKFTAAQLASPGTKATTHLSVLDGMALCYREWELLVEDWDRDDFTLWQPRRPNPFLGNTLLDNMYANVKKRESKFVASVTEYRQSTVGAGAALQGRTYTVESAEAYFKAAAADIPGAASP